MINFSFKFTGNILIKRDFHYDIFPWLKTELPYFSFIRVKTVEFRFQNTVCLIKFFDQNKGD
jgi:hypothetical protein